MKKIYVIPKQGRQVGHTSLPGKIPAAGEWLPEDVETHRLLQAGDVERAQPPKTKAGDK
jgi:hypothetical protein